MKKNFKKSISAILLIICLVAGLLAGCGRDSASVGIIGGADGPTQIIVTDEHHGEEEHHGEQHHDEPADHHDEENHPHEGASPVEEDGCYTDKDSVALYIKTFGHLPSNYITKAKAKDLGWPGGPLEDYAPGKCIGGDRFGNREGLLPEAGGRVWTECDVNCHSTDERGAERIVFSNDGLIYYTCDHYESFQPLG